MADNLTRLLQLLNQNAEALRELSRALHREQQCIVGLDTDGLAEAGRRRQELEALVHQRAADCRYLMAEVARERGFEQVRSISELVSLVEPKEAEQILELKALLAAAAAAAERQNSINKGLVTHTLDTVKRSMALFGKFLGGCETYGSAGQMAEGRNAACLVCGEI